MEPEEIQSKHRMQSRIFSDRKDSLTGYFNDDTLGKLHHTFGFDPNMLKNKETDTSFMEDYIFNPQTGLLKSLTGEGITIDMLKNMSGRNTKYNDYSSLEDFFRENMNTDSIGILFDDISKLMKSEKLSATLNKSKKPKTKRNNKRRKRKRKTRKKKSQKGGFCAPCLIGPIFTAAGLGTTGYMMSSSSSSSNINGKRSVKRKEKYEINKNGKTHKREFKQKDKRVYDGKQISEYDTIKQASKAYDDLIKKCKAKGFQKC